VRVGDRVVLAGRAGVADNVTIGDDAILTGGAGVLAHVPAGRVVAGTPAVPLEAHLDSYKTLRRLPRLIARLEALLDALRRDLGAKDTNQ
jgi:UDP-3-O-[3-hydroxymyristoyl] glucosamine N-acyltransferase